MIVSDFYVKNLSFTEDPSSITIPGCGYTDGMIWKVFSD
jgi:hypothetical protein